MELVTSFKAGPSCVLVNLRNVSRVHQFSGLAHLPLAERLALQDAEFGMSIKPEHLYADDALVARKALLYSEAVVLNDPAQLLSSQPDLLSLAENGSMTARADDGPWEMLWQSAVSQLGLLHKLVQAGIVTLYPMVDFAFGMKTETQAGREREQIAELQELYADARWRTLLGGLGCGNWQQAGVQVGWMLGQFAWRNIVVPGVTPWLPDSTCLSTLASIEKSLGDSFLGAESLTLARMSSQVGIDVAKVSDEDIITMRGSEALFATWRQIVAELSPEADRLAVDRAADVRTLVRAKEMLWRAELDRRVGNGGVLAGLLDANPITCGLISGGVAVASGIPPGLAAASALGGGLATPLLRLFANLSGTARSRARQAAVSAHFMALEG
jgi:hypothetical protein